MDKDKIQIIHDTVLSSIIALAFVFFIYLHPQPSTHALIAWVVVGAYVYGIAGWKLVAKAFANRFRGGQDAGSIESGKAVQATSDAPVEGIKPDC